MPNHTRADAWTTQPDIAPTQKRGEPRTSRTCHWSEQDNRQDGGMASSALVAYALHDKGRPLLLMGIAAGR